MRDLAQAVRESCKAFDWICYFPRPGNAMACHSRFAVLCSALHACTTCAAHLFPRPSLAFPPSPSPLFFSRLFFFYKSLSPEHGNI